MDEEPHRLDWVYNLYDDNIGIPRTLADGLTTQIVAGDNSMLSVVSIEPHSEGELHSHSEEQWGVLLEGKCVRIQEAKEVYVEEGDFWHTPPNTEHTVKTEEEGALILDIFSPPRPEYRSSGTGFESNQNE